MNKICLFFADFSNTGKCYTLKHTHHQQKTKHPMTQTAEIHCKTQVVIHLQTADAQISNKTFYRILRRKQKYMLHKQDFNTVNSEAIILWIQLEVLDVCTNFHTHTQISC